MRKIFFMSALALASLAGTAKVQIPQFFFENFGENDGFTLPDTWDYTGIDATPDDPEHFFIKGEYWVPLASDKSTIWAVSNSSFKRSTVFVRRPTSGLYHQNSQLQQTMPYYGMTCWLMDQPTKVNTVSTFLKMQRLPRNSRDWIPYSQTRYQIR